jgi:hypothetical protein
MQPRKWVAASCLLLGPTSHEALNALTIATLHAIADTGATSIFIMDGVDIVNKCTTLKLLTINLPDGKKVRSTHVHNIAIPGLPIILTGHIVLDLALALLIGIRPLCKVGCHVIFDNHKCEVEYKGNVILKGYKDPSIKLRMLPIVPDGMQSALSQPPPIVDRTLHPHQTFHDGVNLASFTHSVHRQSNGVKFAHQSLCNPKLSTLLKAVRKGFLKGCPNMSEKLILKYLNPNPATAKGHMKCPRHGIRSTRPKPPTAHIIVPVSIIPSVLSLMNVPIVHNEYRPTIPGPAIIDDNTNKSIAIFFCVGAFADHQSGVVFNDLTGNFPFMSYNGSVCFLVVYHYESNAILALPITGLDDKAIFEAYKIAFDELAATGFKPKLNIMDNQATKYIKKDLTEEECKLQLVKPHNRCINAAKHAIQMFKDAFIAALAITDSNSPLQLWDRLTPQVLNCLNMMRASRIDPTKSAYEIIYGPYNWNRYPLAPLGCKAVVYKDGDTRGSWASRGVDGWYLCPSMDHYWCDIYYIPETCAYRISGSTKLFPQCCQLPNMLPHQHLRALTDELTDLAPPTNATLKGKRLLQLLQTWTQALLNLPPILLEQRVDNDAIACKEKQRVIDNTPILTIPCITEAPAIMQSCNPTAKQTLKNTHTSTDKSQEITLLVSSLFPRFFPPSLQQHSR